MVFRARVGRALVYCMVLLRNSWALTGLRDFSEELEMIKCVKRLALHAGFSRPRVEEFRFTLS